MINAQTCTTYHMECIGTPIDLSAFMIIAILVNTFPKLRNLPTYFPFPHFLLQTKECLQLGGYMMNDPHFEGLLSLFLHFVGSSYKAKESPFVHSVSKVNFWFENSIC